MKFTEYFEALSLSNKFVSLMKVKIQRLFTIWHSTCLILKIQ